MNVKYHQLYVKLLIILLLLASHNHLWAEPITVLQAKRAALGWTILDAQPLGANLGVPYGNPVRYQLNKIDFYIQSLHPQGFIILSGDDDIEPIIAFSPTGRFTTNSNNPLFEALHKDLTQRLETAKKYKINPNKTRWRDLQSYANQTSKLGVKSLSDVRVAPLVKSQWSQAGAGNSDIPFYNYYTPLNYVCGCVATSMAQVMRYHAYPQAAVGAKVFNISVNGAMQSRHLLGGNENGGPYDWNNMPLKPSSNASLAQRKAVGALCHDAGVSVGMAYTWQGSYAYTVYDVPPALTNTFSYASAVGLLYPDMQIDYKNAVNANLDCGYPVILAIYGSLGGHAVICDGYGYQNNNLYYHLNMGWSGYDDLWYNVPDIRGSYANFDMVTGVVYNIFPDASSEIISGRITAKGKPVSGVLINAVQSNGYSFFTYTNAKGIYSFRAPAESTFSITAYKKGYFFSPVSVTTGKSSFGSRPGNLWGQDIAGIIGSGPCPPIELESNHIDITEGGTGVVGVRLAEAPGSDVTITINKISGDSSIKLKSKSKLTFTPMNWNAYQAVTLSASYDNDSIEGSAEFSFSSPGAEAVSLSATEREIEIITNPAFLTIPEMNKAEIAIKLSRQPISNVSIKIANGSGDKTISPTNVNGMTGTQTLTFTPDNWHEEKNICIIALSDNIAADTSGTLKLSAPYCNTVEIPVIKTNVSAFIDEFESEDNSNNPPTLTLDEPMVRSINPINDVDWFAFSGTAGTTYIIETDSLLATRIKVFNEAGAVLLADASSGGWRYNAKLLWNCTSTEQVRIQVVGARNTVPGYYSITATTR